MSTDDPYIDKINSMVRKNRRLAIKELSEERGIPVKFCYEILKEKLKMHCVTAKFIPRLMTEIKKSIASNFVRNCLIAQKEMKTFCLGL